MASGDYAKLLANVAGPNTELTATRAKAYKAISALPRISELDYVPSNRYAPDCTHVVLSHPCLTLALLRLAVMSTVRSTLLVL